MIAAVQTLSDGGENNLRSHRQLDGFWFVLKGCARFYTTDDEIVAELGPMEGVLIPRNFPYWFESVGDEDLHLLQIETTGTSIDEVFAGAGDRVEHTPPKEDLQARKSDFIGALDDT
jgi:mannose-6-phosphate isomerase-like protein (cupin superfamily)